MAEKKAAKKKVAKKKLVKKKDVHITQAAYVRFDASASVNIGNYESIKVNVGLSMPCSANSEDMKAVYLELSSKVKALLRMEVEKIREESLG